LLGSRDCFTLLARFFKGGDPETILKQVQHMVQDDGKGLYAVIEHWSDAEHQR